MKKHDVIVMQPVWWQPATSCHQQLAAPLKFLWGWNRFLSVFITYVLLHISPIHQYQAQEWQKGCREGIFHAILELVNPCKVISNVGDAYVNLFLFFPINSFFILCTGMNVWLKNNFLTSFSVLGDTWSCSMERLFAGFPSADCGFVQIAFLVAKVTADKCSDNQLPVNKQLQAIYSLQERWWRQNQAAPS